MAFLDETGLAQVWSKIKSLVGGSTVVQAYDGVIAESPLIGNTYTPPTAYSVGTIIVDSSGAVFRVSGSSMAVCLYKSDLINYVGASEMPTASATSPGFIFVVGE